MMSYFLVPSSELHIQCELAVYLYRLERIEKFV